MVMLLGGHIDETLSLVNETDQDFTIYPNPVKNWLHIKLSNIRAEIKLHDINGKLLLNQKLSSRTNAIDISNVESGVYLLTINTENSSETKRIIKD